MSNTTATATPAGGSGTARPISEAVIRLAGRSEQEVMTFMTIPSTISGGPSIFQVRIGSGEVLSAGDEADALLCFYDHSYANHIRSLKRGGIALYASPQVEPNEEMLGTYHHVGVPISSLTVEAIGGTGRDKGKNIYSLGLLARMFDLNVTKLTKLVEERFTGKDPTIVQNALACFNSGYGHQVQGLWQTFQFHPGANAGQQ